MLPSLCHILKFLCCSLKSCCLHLLQVFDAAAIGTIQILVGLFNIGLGPGRTSTHPGDLTSLGAAYWLGSVFIVSGIVSILAGQLGSSCLTGFSVFMNIAGGIFAITAVVLYGTDLRDASLLWICDRSSDHVVYYEDNCRNVALFAQKLLKSLDITLITLALLQLAVNIRYAIWGIRALCPQDDKDVEEQLPQVMEEIPEMNTDLVNT